MFCWIFTKLAKFFCTGCKGGPVWEIVYKAPGISIGGLMSVSIVSGSTQEFGLSLGPDAHGNTPGTLPGPVTWTADNGATLVPSADTTTVSLTAGAIGTVNLTATSGAVTATLAIEVTAGPAVSMTIVEVAPAPAPAAPAA